MKNFETLYKILMNEAEYEDLAELQSTENELNMGENPDEVNPHDAKVQWVIDHSPKLTREEAEKLVKAGLFDVFKKQIEDSGDISPDVDALNIDDLNDDPQSEFSKGQMGLPTKDDFSDIALPKPELQDRE